MNDELKSQLTAWALDELPADEKARLEAAMASLPEAQSYAAKTRDFCAVLSLTLGPPQDASLTEDQRELLAQKLVEPVSRNTRAIPVAVSRVMWSLAAAAVVVGLAVVAEQWNRRPEGLAIANEPTAPMPTEVLEERLGTRHDSPDASGKTAPRPDGTESSNALALNRGIEPLVRQPAELKDSPANADGTIWSFGEPTTPGDSFGVNPQSESLALDESAGRKKFTSFHRLVEHEADVSSPPTPDSAGKPSAPGTTPDALASNVSRSETIADGVSRESLAKATISPTSAPPGPAPISSFSPPDGGSGAIASAETQPTPAAPVNPAGPAATVPSPAEPASAATPLLAASRARGGLNRSAGLAESSRPDGEAKLSTSLGADADKTRTRFLSLSSGIAAADPAQPDGGVRRLLREERRPDKAELYFYEQGLRVTPSIPSTPNTEAYESPPENPFQSTSVEPLSTFSIDVDTASYANVRRFLNQGQRPPKAAVRLEEMINYFTYDYPQPPDGKPFSVTVDLAECPWNPVHRLARIGLKGRDLAPEKRPTSNLVFLVDVSGSMQEPNKLPLVKQSLSLLVEKLGENDRVAMVTYAGNSGLVLDSTTSDKKQPILAAVDRLEAGGSTHGSAGIQQAYEVAVNHFIKGGVNRVILLTDGDFNVGITDRDALNNLIVEKARSGVFLSVLGYGMGNLKDVTMEMLADKGNGNYAYIDSLGEARKVLSEQINSTLVTIAKDVKIQIEFNPAVVRSYRLVGYENRILAKEDFNDDKKDAGEIGAGHSVTALYEIVPVGAPPETPPVDPLRYRPKPLDPAVEPKPDLPVSRESMTVKLRYKAPDGDQSQLIEVPVVDEGERLGERRADFKFASGVAAFGLLLKDSAYKGGATWELVRQLALEGKGADALGYRGEFIQLIDKARGITPQP